MTFLNVLGGNSFFMEKEDMSSKKKAYCSLENK